MDFLDVIFTRRSVRKFNSKQVSAENIETLLRAAMSAPSAHDERPWQFLVITEREILDQIAKGHPYATMCLQAPLAIIPCVDLSAKNDIFWVQDMAAAVQNILLTARALNLGAVWLGVYPKEQIVTKVQKILQLPEGIIPFNIIPIGYSDVTQSKVDRYSVDKIHNNKW